MKKHILTTKKGRQVTVSTDDTFTMVIGDMEKDADWYESTPGELVKLFGWGPLYSLLESGKCDQSEEVKIRKALRIN